MRNVSAASRAILTNADAIAVSQDPLGQMGLRLENSSSAPLQRWWRVLANGDVAVGLYNKAGGAPAAPALNSVTVVGVVRMFTGNRTVQSAASATAPALPSSVLSRPAATEAAGSASTLNDL